MNAITAEQSDDLAAEAAKYVASCRRVGKRTRGRKAEAVTSFLVAGLPRFDDEAAWRKALGGVLGVGTGSRPELTPADQLYLVQTFTRSALTWILRNAGEGSRLVRCAIHCDEASPHAHISIVCADPQKRLGWNRIRSGFARSPVGRGEHDRGLRELQDRFHAEVTKKYGMERGQPTGVAGRKHEPIDRDKGLRSRLDEELRRSEDLRLQVEQLQRRNAELTDRLKPKRTRTKVAARPSTPARV